MEICIKCFKANCVHVFVRGTFYYNIIRITYSHSKPKNIAFNRMNPSVYLKTAVILFFIDLAWIATGGIFARHMTERIQGKPLSLRYVAAALVYFVLAYMLLQTTSYQQAFLYGVSIYAVYDLTSLTVYEDYDWKFAIADTLWGGVLFMSARYLLKNVA